MSATPSEIYYEQLRTRRERIATAILAGMATNGLPGDVGLRDAVLDKVLVYTDALIARLAR